MASMMAVLPEPTGPPIPMRVIFFIARLPRSVHEHADVRLTWRAARTSNTGAKAAMSSRRQSRTPA